MVVDEHEHPGNHLARLFRATTCPRKICCSTSSTAKLAPKTLSSNFGTSHCRSCSYRHELIVALLNNLSTGQRLGATTSVIHDTPHLLITFGTQR
jgi:hypothetical protein